MEEEVDKLELMFDAVDTSSLTEDVFGVLRALVLLKEIENHCLTNESVSDPKEFLKPLLALIRIYDSGFLFQKADSDLDYIQYRLEYEIKANHPDSAGEKNPVTLLKELSAIKSRYQTLHARFKPIAVEQKETKNRICATFNKTMTIIQELQKQTDLELSPLTEEEKTAAHQLKSHMSDL